MPRLWIWVLVGCTRLDAADDHVLVEAASTPTGDLIGWNIGRGTLYGPQGDPLHPEWRTAGRTAAFAHLATLQGPSPSLVRFSGLQIDGTLGDDGYHWWTYADPEHTPGPGDNMAPFQYMAIIDEMEAEPLVTLNLGSGTAAEAADYVAHLVGTDPSDGRVAARQHWGRDEPWRPRAYELGNEIYALWNTGYGEGEYSFANPDAPHGGDPDWHGRPAAHAPDYAARALTYVDAVLEVDPGARFWIPLSQASMDAWEGPDAAVDALRPLLEHGAVEAVVVHHYQVDDAVTLGFDDYASPELLLGGFEIFRPLYAQLDDALATLNRPDPVEVVVTEYHVAGAFTFGRFDPLASTGWVGLGVADILLGFAQIGIHAAEQHMAVAFGGPETEELLFETWYNPMGADGKPRSSALVTGLIAAHLGAQTHGLTAECATVSYASGEGSFEAPVLHGAAFSDDDRGTVLLLHRDLDNPRSVTLDLPEDWVVRSASLYTTGQGWQGEGSVEAVAWEQAGARVQLQVPAASLVAIDAAR